MIRRHTISTLRVTAISCVIGLVTLVDAGSATAQLLPSFGRDRAGTSGFQFLKLPPDARSAAMGQTVVTNAMDASSMYWNPALLPQIRRSTIVGFSNTQYHSDVVLNYAAFAQRLGSFRIGANVLMMDSGNMDVTTEFQPFGTGESFSVYDFSAGLTVAQALTDLFSYGITARYIEEGIASVKNSTVAFDAGIFYRIGFTGVQMAVAIRSFGFDSSSDGSIDRTLVGSPSVVTEEAFEAVTLPTTFMLGLSYDLFSAAGDGKSLILSGQLNNPNDNSESFNLGIEYVWADLLSLRTGYRFGVEELNTPSFGAGILVPGLQQHVRFDYGFNQLERLGAVHRVGVDVQL